jgi:hypothetical protein
MRRANREYLLSHLRPKIAWRVWEKPFVLLLLLLVAVILAALWGWLQHWPTPLNNAHPPSIRGQPVSRVNGPFRLAHQTSVWCLGWSAGCRAT